MFRLKDTYCSAVPNLFAGMTDAIARPEHFRDAINNVKSAYPMFYNMRNSSPAPNMFVTKSYAADETNIGPKGITAPKSPWLVGDIVDSFGPSRLPRRIVIEFPGAMEAVEEEINDLLKSRGVEPSGVIAVASDDSPFKNAADSIYFGSRGGSIVVYKDRLCARCALAPATHDSFTTSPTLRRFGV